MKPLYKKLVHVLLICFLCISCGYKKDVTLRFEGGNKYHIEKWVWYNNDAICMQWYDVRTDNIDSLYKTVLIDCDSIIEKHKRIVNHK